MDDAINALRECEYKLSCLIERFNQEDHFDVYEFGSDEPCSAEELCGHWACDECGCIKDARDRARKALEPEGGTWER